MRGGSLLVLILLMVIGAGSASTGGGIKTSTLAVVVRSTISEFQRDPITTLFNRRLSLSIQRQALALVVAALGTVGTATFLLAVIHPEIAGLELLFHTVTGRLLDHVAIDEGFALVEIMAPASMVGSSLAETNVRQRYDVTVVCRKSVGSTFTAVTADTVLEKGDVLLIAGTTSATKRFADAVTR
ncbi:MAG: cation:proton antiporter regulatory subunit [Acidimicrobiales bacterium]